MNLDMLLRRHPALGAAVATWIHTHLRHRGLPRARRVLDLARAGSASAQESRLRMMWVLDAGLLMPRLNQWLYDADGRLLGCADLLDADAAVVGEYDGEHHADARQRTHDHRRRESMERAGLIVVQHTMIDLGPGRQPAVHRLRRAHGVGLARDRSRDGDGAGNDAMFSLVAGSEQVGRRTSVSRGPHGDRRTVRRIVDGRSPRRVVPPYGVRVPLLGRPWMTRLVGVLVSGFLLLVAAALPARAESAGGALTLSSQVGIFPEPPDYALAITTLADGRRAALRWNPCQVITYQVNVGAVPLSRRAAVAGEIRAAVAKLSAATGMVYRYEGTTTTVPRTSNVTRQKAELVVAVTTPARTDFEIGGGMLGYGGYRYWEWSRPAGVLIVSDVAIARGWVVVDVAGLMSLRGGFGPGATRGNVLLHELAHTVGLEHVDDTDQLLFSSLRAGAPNGYADGDLAGLARVGRAAGCLDVPSSVISDLS